MPEHTPFYQFGYVVYPLWRRKMPAWLKPVALPLLSQLYPVKEDSIPPQTAQQLARFLVEWRILPDISGLTKQIAESTAPITQPAPFNPPALYEGAPLRLPAQWEPTERVLISWGVLYPPVWAMFAEMAEAISAVATVEILVPHPMWARGVWAYLQHRQKATLTNVTFTIIPTDDIWIRDYGATIGIAPDGERVAINAIYDPLPAYPQGQDNGMASRWASHHALRVANLGLHSEGGNLWSDGNGTLIMSKKLFSGNPHLSQDAVLAELHRVIDVKKLIITPHLIREETGHVDLLIKLVGETTAFVSAPEKTTSPHLEDAQALLKRETNARGDRYNVIELPTPPLYMNWNAYHVRRSYTNALTVNGRVLVPTFGISSDDTALKAYQEALPTYDIVPIDSRIGIHGGGAVHCMTKEIF